MTRFHLQRVAKLFVAHVRAAQYRSERATVELLVIGDNDGTAEVGSSERYVTALASAREQLQPEPLQGTSGLLTRYNRKARAHGLTP